MYDSVYDMRELTPAQLETRAAIEPKDLIDCLRFLVHRGHPIDAAQFINLIDRTPLNTGELVLLLQDAGYGCVQIRRDFDGAANQYRAVVRRIETLLAENGAGIQNLSDLNGTLPTLVAG